MKRYNTGQPEALRRRNRELVMSLVEQEFPVSRASLARMSGLSRTTVSHLVNELIEIGFVEEQDVTINGRGRPATPLIVNRKGWHAVGAELRSRQWVIVAINLLGEVVSRNEIPIPHMEPQAATRELIKGLRPFLSAISGQILPVIGLGLPGLIDIQSGVITRAVDGDWTEFRSVQDRIKSDFGFETHVINRHRAAGLAEVRYGAGKDIAHLVYLGIGTGIAGGIFWDGELVLGANQSSGEFGHVTVLPDGPLCFCGNTGCLQTVASGAAIVKHARTLIQQGEKTVLARSHDEEMTSEEDVTGEDVVKAAAEGDALALTCLTQAARFLAIAVANIINEYNPSAVILGGPIGEMGEPLIPLLRSEVKRRAMSRPLSVVEIMPASLGRDAGAIGAASLALDRKFDFAIPASRA